MAIKFESNLSFEWVLFLLKKYNNSFEPPLDASIDIYSYAEKLSKNSYFVLSNEGLNGFISYYLNIDNSYAYISLIVVDNSLQNKGIAQKMIDALIKSIPPKIKRIKLEVLKNNDKAMKFYKKNNFSIISDHKEKWLMELSL